MTEGTRASDGRPRHRCLVCLEPIGPGEQRHTVRFRGGEHDVCCPSCAQVINRAPLQFVEQP